MYLFYLNGDVYSWGIHYLGQCRHGESFRTSLNEPKLIESVEEFVIDHSYVRNVDKKHYPFGSNGYGGCDAKEIIEIKLGNQNTIVTVFV